MGRLLALARSPRIAVSLILGICIYVGLVTAVPQRELTPQEHAVWAAGDAPLTRTLIALELDRGYTTPAFLLLTALLGFSTAVCSWDRSVDAARRWRERGMVVGTLTERIADREPATFDGDDDAARQALVRALESLGLKVKQGRTLGFADRGALALFGSPVFHWSLVVFIVFAALGYLTRWDGQLGVPERSAVLDVAESYQLLDTAPLALPHTGWSLQVTEVFEDRQVGDVNYGVVPIVAVLRGNDVIGTGEVRSNKPLRAGPLLIHLADHGLSVGVEVLDASGASRGRSDRILDFNEATESGTTESSFDVTGESSVIASVSVEVAARDRRGYLPRLLPPTPLVQVTVNTSDGSSTRQMLRVNEVVELPDGWSLKVNDVGYYLRLSVVRDWSTWWLYLASTAAILGLTPALLMPYRAVWFRLESEGSTTTIRVLPLAHRYDRTFPLTLDRALTQEGIRFEPQIDPDPTPRGTP